MSARILILGCELRACESIATVGEMLGLSKSTAFRTADSEAWPTIGRHGARRVIVPALAGTLGIPYEVLPIAERVQLEPNEPSDEVQQGRDATVRGDG